MILTSSQVKVYIQEASSSNDTLIDAFIDPVLWDSFEYMNNFFHNNNVRVRSHNLTFSTTGTITIDGTNFSTYSFVSGDEIHIENSARNDGVYTAATVSSATITISSAQTIKAETWETDVTITKMDVPPSLIPVMSAMIQHKINNPVGGYKSESLGDYSYTMTGDGAYPDAIYGALNKYRRVKFV